MRYFIKTLKKFSIFKRSFSFIFALIIMFSFVSCQFSVATYCAEEVGIETVAVTTGALYSAVVSGQASSLVTDFFKRAVVFGSEIKTSYFMPSDTIDEFYDNYMYSLDSSIQNGDILEADIGNIRYVGGEPVSFDCPTLGCYAFFCNRPIADRIAAYSGEKNISVVASIVDGYWDQEFYRIRRANFHALVSDPENWQVCFDSTDVYGDVIYKSFWETFGVSLSSPSSSFYETGNWINISMDNYVVSLSMKVRDIPSFNDFVVISIPNYHDNVNGEDYFRCALYGHLVSEVNPSLYSLIDLRSVVLGRYHGSTVQNGLRSLSLTQSRADGLGFEGVTTAPNPFDISLIIPNWGELIAGTDIGILNPTNEWWNTKDWEDVVDAVAQDVADAIAVGATDIPIPDVVDETDLPATDFTDATDFPDTTGIIAADDEADFPDIPIPTPTPDPNPDDPNEPDIPDLHIPALLTLFPFCIPFDIKKACELFLSSDYSPVIHIPLNIGISGRPLINHDFVVDLSDFGIQNYVLYFKYVQIVAYIVVLGYATSKMIF